jgi:hypothetical protein
VRAETSARAERMAFPKSSVPRPGSFTPDLATDNRRSRVRVPALAIREGPRKSGPFAARHSARTGRYQSSTNLLPTPPCSVVCRREYGAAGTHGRAHCRASPLQRQTTLQPPQHPRLLGPDRALLAQRQTVRADHADHLATRGKRSPRITAAREPLQPTSRAGPPLLKHRNPPDQLSGEHGVSSD